MTEENTIFKVEGLVTRKKRDGTAIQLTDRWYSLYKQEVKAEVGQQVVIEYRVKGDFNNIVTIKVVGGEPIEPKSSLLPSAINGKDKYIIRQCCLKASVELWSRMAQPDKKLILETAETFEKWVTR